MKKTLALTLILSGFWGAVTASAMDLDWSGQFRTEAAWISNYAMDSGDGALGRDGVRDAADGYYVYSAGQKKAQFQTLFMRLTPKLVVNDNVSIKSEWWLGNPISGFYGDGYPGGTDNFHYSTTNKGSSITAQRFWAEFISDIGTLQVGRAPIHWGLGLVHHSGDGLFDRYQTTGDTIRLVSKFGAFSLIPAATKYKNGGAVGGTCAGAIAADGTCASNPAGGGGLSEYSLALRYENVDEDFEGGVNFIRRLAGAQSNVAWINNTVGGMNYTIWDIYAKKKAGKFTFAFEAPIYTGDLIGIPYKSYAVAGEVGFKATDSWDFGLKAGKVPGQGSSVNGLTDKWTTVYFHPNYRLGLIMFNYQLRNFARNNDPSAGTSASIYDNPVTNANYLALGGSFRADKWKFSLGFVTATADESAESGRRFFNTWNRAYSGASAVKDQPSGLGSEIDLGVALQWDEFTRFAVDFGYYMPGSFYSFSNTATDNATDSVFGVVTSVGVAF